MYDAVKLACIVLVDDMLQCCPTLLPNQVAVVFLASSSPWPQRQQQRRPGLGSNGMLLEAQLHGEEIDSSRFAPLLRCQPSPSPDARHEQGHSGHAPHVPTPRLHCTVRQYPQSLSYAHANRGRRQRQPSHHYSYQRQRKSIIPPLPQDAPSKSYALLHNCPHHRKRTGRAFEQLLQFGWKAKSGTGGVFRGVPR
jgi:hypothetical protein